VLFVTSEAKFGQHIDHRWILDTIEEQMNCAFPSRSCCRLSNTFDGCTC
jgi:hypothetical protein